MTEYRKKPVVVEARQFDGTNRGNLVAWMRAHGVETIDPLGDRFLISTLEGTMTASPGDFIIKGVSGEFYPCKPDIFEKTYEAAHDAALFPAQPATADRETIAWALWCANEGYLKAEDREGMTNWLLDDPANDGPGDNRQGWLELADTILASGVIVPANRCTADRETLEAKARKALDPHTFYVSEGKRGYTVESPVVGYWEAVEVAVTLASGVIVPANKIRADTLEEAGKAAQDLGDAVDTADGYAGDLFQLADDFISRAAKLRGNA